MFLLEQRSLTLLWHWYCQHQVWTIIFEISAFKQDNKYQEAKNFASRLLTFIAFFDEIESMWGQLQLDIRKLKSRLKIQKKLDLDLDLKKIDLQLDLDLE